nr:hypothetical protein [Tanacetum cinerariifolium]
MTAHDPTQKEMATSKKEERINQAEYEKQIAQDQNATQRQATQANTGHGTGQPAGNVVEGVVKSHPIGKNTGTGTTLAGHNSNAGGATGAAGYSTDGAYR